MLNLLEIAGQRSFAYYGALGGEKLGDCVIIYDEAKPDTLHTVVILNDGRVSVTTKRKEEVLGY